MATFSDAEHCIRKLFVNFFLSTELVKQSPVNLSYWVSLHNKSSSARTRSRLFHFDSISPDACVTLSSFAITRPHAKLPSASLHQI